MQKLARYLKSHFMNTPTKTFTPPYLILLLLVISTVFSGNSRKEDAQKNSSLILLNVSPFWQQITKGLVILAVVIMDRLNHPSED